MHTGPARLRSVCESESAVADSRRAASRMAGIRRSLTASAPPRSRCPSATANAAREGAVALAARRGRRPPAPSQARHRSRVTARRSVAVETKWRVAVVKVGAGQHRRDALAPAVLILMLSRCE